MLFFPIPKVLQYLSILLIVQIEKHFEIKIPRYYGINFFLCFLLLTFNLPQSLKCYFHSLVTRITIKIDYLQPFYTNYNIPLHNKQYSENAPLDSTCPTIAYSRQEPNGFASTIKSSYFHPF